MKKILFLIAMLFLSINVVSAADLECKFVAENNANVPNWIQLDFTLSGDSINSIDTLVDDHWFSFGFDYDDEIMIVDETLTKNFKSVMYNKLFVENDGLCPAKVRLCKANDDLDPDLFDTYDKIIIAIDSKYFYKLNTKKEFTMDETTWLMTPDSDECQVYDIEGGVGVDFNGCDGIQTNLDALKKYYDSKEFTKYKQEKETVVDFCDSILNSMDYIYSEEENTVTACVATCLGIKNYMPDEYGNNDLSDCGFSDRLVIWIANVVRWIKYIIPVVVMALGILDFIKAMAGDKDDEMKKAQGRFVKRLIAAALIFLAPIIIEFILDKMGFAANDCGIIDL